MVQKVRSDSLLSFRSGVIAGVEAGCHAVAIPGEGMNHGRYLDHPKVGL